ncbi:MAG: hypothetical protein IPP88_07065 [Betaproteobacteria bacterium]|nr:hypothetical protein [Betaproteobacteria bacterium]
MSEQSSANLVRSPLAWLTLLAVIVISVGLFWQNERELAKQRFEQARVASEQAELRRVKESEERREKERLQVLQDIRAQKEAEDTQREKAIAIRQSEVQNKKFVADERYVSPQQTAYQSYQMLVDQRRRDYDDRRQRFEDEYNLQKARQEVERQKRYLQEREREEQVARLRRDETARYGR